MRKSRADLVRENELYLELVKFIDDIWNLSMDERVQFMEMRGYEHYNMDFYNAALIEISARAAAVQKVIKEQY